MVMVMTQGREVREAVGDGDDGRRARYVTAVLGWSAERPPRAESSNREADELRFHIWGRMGRKLGVHPTHLSYTSYSLLRRSAH